MPSYARKRLHESNLNKLLTALTPPFAARDQYIQRIRKLVRSKFQVDKKWEEQSHHRLSKELNKLFPDVWGNPEVEQASLKFARASFSCHRKTYLQRIRWRKLREANQVTSEADEVAAIEPGPRLPVVTRQRQIQSNAGPSVITAPPRVVELSISASFIASTYMERVMNYTKEHNLQRRAPEKNSPRIPESAPNMGRTRRCTPSPPATPPNSLLTVSQRTPASTAQNYLHNDTQLSDVNPPKPPVSATETNSRTCSSNERIESGIEEVKSFLENCSPSMVHHLDSFIRAGVKNGEYLKAVGRLCASDTTALSSVLGSSILSTIDSILLREHLLRWVEGRSVNNGVAQEYTAWFRRLNSRGQTFDRAIVG